MYKISVHYFARLYCSILCFWLAIVATHAYHKFELLWHPHYILFIPFLNPWFLAFDCVTVFTTYKLLLLLFLSLSTCLFETCTSHCWLMKLFCHKGCLEFFFHFSSRLCFVLFSFISLFPFVCCRSNSFLPKTLYVKSLSSFSSLFIFFFKFYGVSHILPKVKMSLVFLICSMISVYQKLSDNENFELFALWDAES